MKTQNDVKWPKPVILADDPSSARAVTGVTGWIDRVGMFHGHGLEAKLRAQQAGATHVLCTGCKLPVRKPVVKCMACRTTEATEKFFARARRMWTGDEPVFSETAEEYFNSDEELDDYCGEHSTTREALRLRLCTEVPYPQLDEEHFYLGTEDLDLELPKDLYDALNTLNIIAARSHSGVWLPSKYRMTLYGEVQNGED